MGTWSHLCSLLWEMSYIFCYIKIVSFLCVMLPNKADKHKQNTQLNVLENAQTLVEFISAD